MDPSADTNTDAPVSSEANTATSKGKGLKKWRRIKRRDITISTSPTSASPPPPKFRYTSPKQITSQIETTKKLRVVVDHKDVESNSSRGSAIHKSRQGVEISQLSDNASSNPSVNQLSFPNSDLLPKSILSLQAVYQALEKEIQNFEEIGKELILLPDGMTDPILSKQGTHPVVSEVHVTNSSDPVPYVIENGSSLPLNLIEIHQKVCLMERELREATTELEVKESRVGELECILNERRLLNGESESSLQSLQQKCREMETELEDLYQQKIEAEVEYFTIRKATQKWKLLLDDQFWLSREQKALIGEQDRIVHRFRDTNSNIVAVKEEVDKLASSGESVNTKKFLKMHSRICKYTLCFTIQLLLLFLVSGFLLFKLYPGSAVCVPT